MSEEKIDNSPKMYFLVNSTLSMGKGKACGQCSHAAAAMTRALELDKTNAYKEWVHNCETKIVLKATQELMEVLIDKYRKKIKCFPVYDAGKSQVQEGSFTVLAFEPLRPGDVPSEILSLKLL